MLLLHFQNMCSKWLIRGPAPWPPDRFAQAVADNISIGGVLSQLGCGVSGTNYLRVHNMVRDLQLDTSHWLGAAYLRGKNHSWTPSIPLSEILVERSSYMDRLRLKRRLVAPVWCRMRVCVRNLRVANSDLDSATGPCQRRRRRQ